MSDYRRCYQRGGCYFFTVKLQPSAPVLLTRHIETLRAAFSQVKTCHPFGVNALVVLPDHLHCLIQLPPGDLDYPTRWRLIKSAFSRQLPATE